MVNNILMCASECWQLDELATCFGVFFVDFCKAKVKGRTNILKSAEQYRRITGRERNGSMIKATFLRILRCDVVLNVTQIKGVTHDTLIVMLLFN